MMRIGSLCSGLGLFELGLEWSGLGKTIWQVEIDAFCRRILNKNWPQSKVFDDVRLVGAAPRLHVLEPADVICFGFPCQDISSAGVQAGLAGARSGLFYECARVVEEIGPEWVVVENVASGAKLWVDAVCRELEQRGYAPLPIPIEARDVGALHLRARVFIVAHSNRRRECAQSRFPEVARASTTDGTREEVSAQGFPGWRDAEPDVVRVVHGRAKELDATELDHALGPAALSALGDLDGARRVALGNAVVPQCSEVIGHVILQLIEEACAA